MASQKGKKDPTNPRVPISAFGHFTKWYLQNESNRLGAAFNPTTFSQITIQAWAQLTTEQKAYFNGLAEQDIQRYNAEKEKQKHIPRVNEVKKKTKKVKDPNAPKRPLTAFFRFCNDERAGVKERNPDFKTGDVAKELGRLWRELSADRKDQYQLTAQTDKERYQQEMTAYQNTGAVLYANPQPASGPK